MAEFLEASERHASWDHIDELLAQDPADRGAMEDIHFHRATAHSQVAGEVHQHQLAFLLGARDRGLEVVLDDDMPDLLGLGLAAVLPTPR